MKQNDLKCSRCKLKIEWFESVDTIEGLILCFGCDSKRLIIEQ